LRARWQIRTTGFEPVQLSVKACVPATKIKERRIKTKMSKTTVLFVLPAAQLHYNRFLSTTSLPLLHF
jgi:hypothetical protein